MLRKKEKPEIIPGDKTLRQSLLLVVAAYILFLIWLEPLIDLLLSLDPASGDPLSINALNQRKVTVSNVAFAITRSAPMMIFFWIGYRAVLSASLPPPKMKFPFTVVRIKGKSAKMFGFLLMTICMVLIYIEMVQLSHKLLP